MCDELRIESPTGADVERAIEALDAETRTGLTLDGHESSISVGGGRGSYVVFVTLGDEEEFWNLLSDPGKTGVTLINIGGQEGDYPNRRVVGKEQATLAALFFLANGRRDPALTWECQV